MKRTVILVAVMVMGLTLSACKTTGKTQSAASSAKISAQAERTAANQVILDWKDRSLGEIAAPLWLLPAIRGDWSQFKETWKVGDGKILKIGAAQNARENTAMTIADVQYAARLANQLKQTVLTRAAISLGSDGEFDAVNDAATKTLVSIAGQERLTDFWQKIETTGENGKKTTVYNYYVVYACDENVWSNLVAKYLYDVIGVLPETKTQQTMAAMFKEIDESLKSEKPKSEVVFKAEITAQQTALQTGGMSPADQRAAYKSGDPVKAAAASTTQADANYIAALAMLAGGGNN
jgi:hypothetical protein